MQLRIRGGTWQSCVLPSFSTPSPPWPSLLCTNSTLTQRDVTWIKPCYGLTWPSAPSCPLLRSRPVCSKVSDLFLFSHPNNSLVAYLSSFYINKSWKDKGFVGMLLQHLNHKLNYHLSWQVVLLSPQSSPAQDSCRLPLFAAMSCTWPSQLYPAVHQRRVSRKECLSCAKQIQVFRQDTTGKTIIFHALRHL